MTQVFDLTTLNGSNGFRVNGFSYNVRNAGDMNGDGYDDLVLGSSVIFGKNTPFSATIDPSMLNGTNGFSIKSECLGEQIHKDRQNDNTHLHYKNIA